jgi:FkbM family methyltransferase
MLGSRSLKTILRAVTQRQHYVAFSNMFRIYQNVPDALMRYIFGAGTYPATVGVKTPIGIVHAHLYTRHDMLTVNEIFCRKDYPSGPDLSVVVDIGSNIGISALYFLTRNPQVRCYLFEPDPKNVGRLRSQLEDFRERYHLTECAISDRDGQVTFGVESTGRYGGIGVATDQNITVQCRHINGVLTEIMQKERAIDIIKIDTEGVEITTVKAMDPELLKHVRAIFIEAFPTENLLPGTFTQRQYGPIAQLENMSASS